MMVLQIARFRSDLLFQIARFRWNLLFQMMRMMVHVSPNG